MLGDLDNTGHLGWMMAYVVMYHNDLDELLILLFNIPYTLYIYSSRVGVLSLTKDVYERFRTQLEVKREGNDYIDLLLCLWLTWWPVVRTNYCAIDRRLVEKIEFNDNFNIFVICATVLLSYVYLEMCNRGK